MSVDTDIGYKSQAQHSPHAPTTKIPRNDVWRAIEYVYDWFTALVPSVGAAPKNAEYLVATADGTLTAERVTTNTATVSWDHTTPAQAKANVIDDSITDAKLRNSAAVSVIGRSANSSGDPADIAAASNDTLFRRVSDALSFGALTLGMIPANLVTFAKLQQITTDRLVGRDTAGTGDMEEISVGGGLEFTGSGGIQRSALTGDVAASAGSGSTTIQNNVVSDAKLRDSAALSVIGRSANSTGDPADIAAGSDGHVLRRSGTTLGFGTIATAGIGDDQVTFGKMQNLTSDRLMGRDTAGSGDPEEITVGGGVEFTGSGGIQRSALTGDVTASAGSNSTTIPNNTVTYAKMQDVTATQRVLGRNSGGSGDPEEVTASQVLDWIGSTRGSVLYRGASGWAILTPGTSGHVLTSNGSGADPSYQAPAGGSGITRGTAQATTSGTAFDFTSLPAGLNRITVILSGVSLSGTDNLLVQIGDSGGLETTGYDSASASISGTTVGGTDSSTSGFISRTANASAVISGQIVLTRIDGNTWDASHSLGSGSGSVRVCHGGGSKTLSDTLDRVRLTRTGTDTFDAGSVNIFYE